MKRGFFDYEILIPPQKINYEQWTKEEATVYFEWFVLNVPNRASYLLEKCFKRKVTVIDCIKATEALVDVWAWFLNHAAIENKPQGFFQNQLEIAPQFGEQFVFQKQLDIKSEFVIRDIAMLISAMFLSKDSSLNWEVETKPDRYVFKNHPVIKGFVDMRYQSPFSAVFEPVHMVRIQALKMIKGTAKKTDLLLLYQEWENMIPQHPKADSSSDG